MTVNVLRGTAMLIIGMASHLLTLAQFPVLKIHDKEDPNVYLHDLCIDVKIAGNIAITTMEMSFYNKSPKILEGELLFPMPEGVSISRYAIDMGGHMREAVPVEKQKATEVFEAVERRRVDPGILEKVEGNNFRTRIYPIPANGSRKVIIAYEEFLTFNKDQSLRYHLPLDLKRSIDVFKLDVSVLQSTYKPVLKQEPDDELQFKEWNNNYSASLSRTDFTPSHSLTIDIPKHPEQVEAMMQEVGGNYYFLVNYFPKKESRSKPKPRDITILWDASLSGLNRDVKKELALLDDYLKYCDAVTVRLVVVNNEFRQVGQYSVTGGNWSDLKQAIEALPYDGGTNYSKISFPAGDEYLFFTDGMQSLGGAGIRLPGKPVYTISSAARSDYAYLQYMAQSTGGVFVNLNSLKVEEATPLLTRQSLQFIGVKADNRLSETYPSIPKPVVNNCTVAGIATGADVPVTLQFGYGKTVTMEKTIVLNYEKQSVNSLNVQKVWAQQKIGELDVRYEENKAMVSLLGKQFGIVTRNTSLIVLEMVEDYVRYEIEPPAELRSQYDQLLKQQLVERSNSRKVTLASAQQQLEALTSWWKMNYSTSPVPIKRKTDALLDTTVDPDGSRGLYRDAFANTNNTFRFTMPRVLVNSAAAKEEDLEEVRIGTTDSKGIADEGVVSAGYGRSKAAGKRSNDGPAATINIKEWTPERIYLKALDKEVPAKRYELYLTLRKDYLSSPTFYYDVASYFLRAKDTARGLMILTNMCEIDLENHELYKLLGFKLREAGAYEEAIVVFRKVLAWRPQEPQSYRDYGLALSDGGRYQQALDTLYAALTRNYNESISSLYDGMEEIIVTEINQLISLHGKKLNISAIDPKLIRDMPVDVRVVLSWNKNDTDIDLWVTDPHKEKCYYGHNETLTGGRISRDLTRGYGPEQFMVKKAMRGKYQVEVNYYGDQQFKISGPTTVMAEIYTHYASGRQERKMITLQMEKEGSREGVLVGEFQFGG